MVVQSECCADKHAVCTSGIDVGSVFMVVQCVCAVLWTDLRGHAVCTSGVDVESVCMVVQSVCVHCGQISEAMQCVQVALM